MNLTLQFETCSKIPEQGFRSEYGGGLVEVGEEGTVVWGRGKAVYRLTRMNNWKKCTDDVDVGARLGVGLVAISDSKEGVCKKAMYLLAVGGLKDGGMCSKKVMVWKEGKWTTMSEMLVGCEFSCVVSVNEGSLVVMGGWSDAGRRLSDVQVFDGNTQTWHFGPPLPQQWGAMSAVVHGKVLYVMGGWGMGTAVWCINVSDLVSLTIEYARNVNDLHSG